MTDRDNLIREATRRNALADCGDAACLDPSHDPINMLILAAIRYGVGSAKLAELDAKEEAVRALIPPVSPDGGSPEMRAALERIAELNVATLEPRGMLYTAVRIAEEALSVPPPVSGGSPKTTEAPLWRCPTCGEWLAGHLPWCVGGWYGKADHVAMYKSSPSDSITAPGEK